MKKCPKCNTNLIRNAYIPNEWWCLGCSLSGQYDGMVRAAKIIKANIENRKHQTNLLSHPLNKE